MVESIPEVISKGVDADFVWFTPVDGLSLQGGVTYAETQFGDFTAADLTDPSRFNSVFRLPGSQMSFAPRWSSSVSADSALTQPRLQRRRRLLDGRDHAGADG